MRRKKYTHVKVYNADTLELLDYFYDFYLATDFIVSGNYAIIALKDFPDTGVQHWGVRCLSE